MEWELWQLTILEKELVTGSDREELGLPSVKSSSCPLTVLIRAPGEREKQAQKTEGREKGREAELKLLPGVLLTWVGRRLSKSEARLSPVETQEATSVKPPLLILLQVALFFLFFRIAHPAPSQAGQGWLQSRLNHVTCL